MERLDPIEYEVRYVSLFDSGRAYAFPCDASGFVDLENLSQRARDSYLKVRERVGREFATPEVMRTTLLA
jgi:hypothetical protein